MSMSITLLTFFGFFSRRLVTDLDFLIMRIGIIRITILIIRCAWFRAFTTVKQTGLLAIKRDWAPHGLRFVSAKHCFLDIIPSGLGHSQW